MAVPLPERAPDLKKPDIEVGRELYRNEDSVVREATLILPEGPKSVEAVFSLAFFDERLHKPEEIERLKLVVRREANRLYAARHAANVVRVYGVVTEFYCHERALGIVRERHERLRTPFRNFSRALWLLGLNDIANGMTALLGNDPVEGYQWLLKPCNLLLDKWGNILIGETGETAMTTHSRVYATGNPAHCPPEEYNPAHKNAFSLTVCAIELAQKYTTPAVHKAEGNQENLENMTSNKHYRAATKFFEGALQARVSFDALHKRIRRRMNERVFVRIHRMSTVVIENPVQVKEFWAEIRRALACPDLIHHHRLDLIRILFRLVAFVRSGGRVQKPIAGAAGVWTSSSAEESSEEGDASPAAGVGTAGAGIGSPPTGSPMPTRPITAPGPSLATTASVSIPGRPNSADDAWAHVGTPTNKGSSVGRLSRLPFGSPQGFGSSPNGGGASASPLGCLSPGGELSDDENEREAVAATGARDLNLIDAFEVLLHVLESHGDLQFASRESRELFAAVAEVWAVIAQRPAAPGREHLFEASDELPQILGRIFPWLRHGLREFPLPDMQDKKENDTYISVQISQCEILACCASSQTLTTELLTLVAALNTERFDIIELARAKVAAFTGRSVLPGAACHALLGLLVHVPDTTLPRPNVRDVIATLEKWMNTAPDDVDAAMTSQERTLAVDTMIVFLRRERAAVIGGADEVKADFRKLMLRSADWLARDACEPETIKSLAALFKFALTQVDPDTPRAAAGGALSNDLRNIVASRGPGRVGKAAVSFAYLTALRKIVHALRHPAIRVNEVAVERLIYALEIACAEGYEHTVWTNLNEVGGIYETLVVIMETQGQNLDVQLSALHILVQIAIEVGSISGPHHEHLVASVARTIARDWQLPGREDEVAHVRECGGRVLHRLFVLPQVGGDFVFADAVQLSERVDVCLAASHLLLSDFYPTCGALTTECLRIVASHAIAYPTLGDSLQTRMVGTLLVRLWMLNDVNAPALWHVLSLIVKLQPMIRRDLMAEDVVQYLAAHAADIQIQADGKDIADVAFTGVSRAELCTFVDRFHAVSVIATATAKYLPTSAHGARMTTDEAETILPRLRQLLTSHRESLLVQAPAIEAMRDAYVTLVPDAFPDEQTDDEDDESLTGGGSVEEEGSEREGSEAGDEEGEVDVTALEGEDPLEDDDAKLKALQAEEARLLAIWTLTAADPSYFAPLCAAVLRFQNDLTLQLHALTILRSFLLSGVHLVDAALWSAVKTALADHGRDDVHRVASEALAAALVPRVLLAPDVTIELEQETEVTVAARIPGASLVAQRRPTPRQPALPALTVLLGALTDHIRQRRAPPPKLKLKGGKAGGSKSGSGAGSRAGSARGSPKPGAAPTPK